MVASGWQAASLPPSGGVVERPGSKEVFRGRRAAKTARSGFCFEAETVGIAAAASPHPLQLGRSQPK